MSHEDRLRLARQYLKRYFPAAAAAALIFWGTTRLLEVASLSAGTGLVWLINLLIEHAFRDAMPIGKVLWFPWQYLLLAICAGLITLVLGIFVGLWVETKNRRVRTSS